MYHSFNLHVQELVTFYLWSDCLNLIKRKNPKFPNVLPITSG